VEDDGFSQALFTGPWQQARGKAVFVWLHLEQALEVCIDVWPISKLEEVASGQLSRAGPFTGLKPHLSY
jgi:hypothetical protein